VSYKEINFLRSSSKSTYPNELVKEGFLQKDKRKFILSKNQFTLVLSNLLTEYPFLLDYLSNYGIDILSCLIKNENISLEEISREIRLSQPSIYRYLKKLISKQIIYKKEKNFFFNKKLWGNLYNFIMLYIDYRASFFNIPSNAKIYYKDLNRAIFSLNYEDDKLNKTGFSLFSQYGINLLENEFFYKIEKKPRFNITSVLLDALRVAGSENNESSRRRSYCFLFYKKNIDKLKKIYHPELDLLKKIFKDKGNTKIINYPTYSELIERCKEYDIKI